MQAHFVPFFLAIILCVSAPAQAETYAQATNAYCEKTKQCVWQQIRTGEEATGAEQRMILNKMDEMCARLLQSPVGPIDSASHKQAAACMRSMANLSCGGILQMSEAAPTDECAELAKPQQ